MQEVKRGASDQGTPFVLIQWNNTVPFTIKFIDSSTSGTPEVTFSARGQISISINFIRQDQKASLRFA
jgi:hypothetical protein